MYRQVGFALLLVLWLCLPGPLTLPSPPADIMEEDLMFRMEDEEEGSAKRAPAQHRAPNKRASSMSDANASDDDDDDHFICPILDDSAKEICHYLKNLVYTRQLSNSLPKSNFVFKVSISLHGARCIILPENRKRKCWNRALEDCLVMLQNILYWLWTLVHHHSSAIVCQNITLPYKESWSVHACTHAPVCVLLLVCISVKWRSGQPALNCTFSKEQEVPETERLVVTCVARKHVSHTWGRDAVQSLCAPADCWIQCPFFLKSFWVAMLFVHAIHVLCCLLM